MKILIVIPIVVGAGILVPVYQQPKVIAKKLSPEAVARSNQESARIAQALRALQDNDVSKMPFVRTTIARLSPGDFRRPHFADLLAKRGELQAAFELEKTRFRFSEYSVLNDQETEQYAWLAERSGHPDEAAWARDRKGADGRFRVWKRLMEKVRFREGRGHSRFPGVYELGVNSAMDDGIRLHPAFPEDIEAMRQKLLERSTVTP